MAEHAEFRVGVVLRVTLVVDSVRETRREHTLPEIVPIQQITYNAFAIQEGITDAPQELEVQAALAPLVSDLNTGIQKDSHRGASPQEAPVT